MQWFYLILAILFEISGTVCMKLSKGFSQALPSILVFVFYVLCFTFLTFALKKIEISMAYAIWSGLGTALITFIGMVYFNELFSILKIICILLIIIGVAGLKIIQ